MKHKSIKILKCWGVLGVFSGLCFLCSENITQGFIWTMYVLMGIIAVFILFGWDRHITYGDEAPMFGHSPIADYEDDDPIDEN